MSERMTKRYSWGLNLFIIPNSEIWLSWAIFLLQAKNRKTENTEREKEKEKRGRKRQKRMESSMTLT